MLTTSHVANWILIGLFAGLWLLSTKRVTDARLLPVMAALGPLIVPFYVIAVIVAAIRKGEA